MKNNNASDDLQLNDQCGSENLEQSTCLTAANWHWIWTI